MHSIWPTSCCYSYRAARSHIQDPAKRDQWRKKVISYHKGSRSGSGIRIAVVLFQLNSRNSINECRGRKSWSRDFLKFSPLFLYNCSFNYNTESLVKIHTHRVDGLRS